MSKETKVGKPAFVPKFEIAAGMHKGRKLEKFVPKHVRPTRRTNVKKPRRKFNEKKNEFSTFFLALEKEQTCSIRS